MTADPHLTLQPSAGIVVLRGYTRPDSKLVGERHAPLEKTLYLDLVDFTEIHFVTLKNDLKNFYTYELVAPKSSIAVCFSKPEWHGESKLTIKRSILFATGRDCPQYVKLRKQIDAFLTEQISRQDWEHLSIYRPIKK